MRTFRSVAIADINVGDRLREEHGDITGLAKSIERFGLLHPIVVDDRMRLVAGERRLRACQLLGWQDTLVRELGELSDAELREIELEENLQRKDLTPYERSRTRVELAETAAAVDLANYAQNLTTNQTRGHPIEPGSTRRVAERIGVSISTMRTAKMHVETADAYPFMQKPDWKQYHVLEAGELLRRIPDDDHDMVAALIDQPAIPPPDALKMLAHLAEMGTEDRHRVFALQMSADPRDRALALTLAARQPAMPDPRLILIQSAIREIRKAADAFPNDPEAAALRDVIATLRSINGSIKASARERDSA